MNSQDLYNRVGVLIQESGHVTIETFPMWAARGHAIAKSIGSYSETATINSNMSLVTLKGLNDAVQGIVMALSRILASAELDLPIESRGAFISTGDALGAFSSVGRAIGEAKTTVRFIDPYMDHATLVDFASTANEGVVIELLADEKDVKPSLRPAVERWQKQFGQSRPVIARVASKRLLHDRLIIGDNSWAYDVTQSFNAIAARSPASIIRVPLDTVRLKIDAYDVLWNEAQPLS